MKNLAAITIFSIMLVTTGCASYLSAKSSQREINTNRIIVSQDKNAMDALRLGVEPDIAIRAIKIDNGIGVGIDLFSIQTLTNHPVRQAISAGIDALLIWGSAELVKYVKDKIAGICTCTCTCTCKPPVTK